MDLAVYRLDLTYEGTAFRGWARQPGLRTVQGVLEEALQVALRRPVRSSVAGRTDAGVHALAQVASFALPSAEITGRLAEALQPERLRLTLNALLPPDVAVTAVGSAEPGFEARSAASRTYRYRLWLSPVRPVHQRAFVWHLHGDVDREALDAAATLLVGRHDFAALTPSAHLYHHCEREVLEARWLRPCPVETAGRGDLPHADRPGHPDRLLARDGSVVEEPEHVFTITATSFLHNMVRVAVGSMVDVAQGRMTPNEFAAALERGERRRMGQTAPARGLALVAVAY